MALFRRTRPLLDADVLIAGAGTAGAACARACALRGLKVLCLDRKQLDEAGARWVNGVPAWAFDVAGVPRPEPPEKLYSGGPFHLFAGRGPIRITLDGRGLFDVDMRLLVARLQADARANGAELRGNCGVKGWERKPSGAQVETDQGVLRARFLVDASGLAGPRLAGQLPVPGTEICSAAQQVREVGDLQAALGWCRAQGVEPGQVICFSGIAGGYSILNVRVETGHGPPRVSLLTGSIPAAGHPGGDAILRQFVEEHAWVGPAIFGGSRALPLSLPPADLSRGPLAMMGDAGCQVFSAHGSGIAQNLISAELFAKTIKDGGDPWDWNVRWQRQWGGLLAASHAFARFSRTLGPEDTATIMQAGLMPPALATRTLLQQPARPGPGDLLRLVRGASRERALALRLLPVVTRMTRLERHYHQYPRRQAALAGWQSRQVELLAEGA